MSSMELVLSSCSCAALLRVATEHFLEFGLKLERGLGVGVGEGLKYRGLGVGEGLKYRGLGIELGLGLGLGGR